MNGEDIMERLFREYFADILSNEDADNDFNVTIEEMSREVFDVEFNTFARIYSHFFYNKNRLMYFINNYEIKLDKKYVEHILKLYNYSREHEMKKHTYLLADFIFTYYNTIHKPEYIKNMGNSNAIKELVAIIKIRADGDTFVNELRDICFDLYQDIIAYSIKNDFFISARTSDKILNAYTEEKYRNTLFDLLLTSKTDVYNLCEHDYDINKHRAYYEDYVRSNIPNVYGFTDINKMIKKLDDNKCISKDFSKEVTNLCIKATNILGSKSVSKEENCINVISAINDLKRLLITINKCQNSFGEYKEKIKKCLYCLMALKRNLLYDVNYVDKGMLEHKFNFTIPREVIDSFLTTIKNNHYNLYNLLKMDFDKCMQNAIKNYSSSPLLSHVTRMRIDSDNKMYYINEEKQINTNSNYKKYYDVAGRKYTQEHSDELQNIISEDYYEEMLIYLQSYFFSNDLGLKVELLKDEYAGILQTMKDFMKYTYDNEYAIIVNNIIAIESTINDLSEKIFKNRKVKTEDNLEELFKYYLNNNSKRNGLMFINYLLYEKSGPNYRNRYVHGNASFSKEFEKPLLCTFAIIIFLGWLINNDNK